MIDKISHVLTERAALFVRLSVCSVVLDDRQNIARAYGTGVGARRGH